MEKVNKDKDDETMEERTNFSYEDEENYEKNGKGEECLSENIEDKRIC